jgi:hypothetical protein
MWQTEQVISNKIKTNLTHLADTNYWTLLYENDDEEELTEEKSNKPQESIEAVQQPTSYKLKRRVERRQEKMMSTKTT